MRKVLMVLLLLAAMPTFAREPSFFEQLDSCAAMTVAYTEFATLAKESDDSDKPGYDMYIQQMSDRYQDHPSVAHLMITLGELAWANRHHQAISPDALEVFHKCENHLGSKT